MAASPTFSFGAPIDMSKIDFQQYAAVTYTVLTATEIQYTDKTGDTITFTGNNFNAFTFTGTVTGFSIVSKANVKLSTGTNLNIPLGTVNADKTSNSKLFNDFFGAANTVIIGSTGVDHLVGGNGGNDVLIGGAGADMLTGGTGNTTFRYLKITDSTPTASDTITNWHKGDKIDLNAVDANTTLAGVQHFKLGTITGKAGDLTVTYNATTNKTSVTLYDNNTGKADGVILLTGKQTLATTDFVGVTAATISPDGFTQSMAGFGAHGGGAITARPVERQDRFLSMSVASGGHTRCMIA